MKKLISLLGLLFLATAVFAQTFTLKTADKNPCKAQTIYETAGIIYANCPI